MQKCITTMRLKIKITHFKGEDEGMFIRGSNSFLQIGLA
jgi:hypothetical protein